MLLATNLDRENWPPRRLGAPLRLRWQIELAFKTLKTTCHMRQPLMNDPGVLRSWVLANLAAALPAPRGRLSLLNPGTAPPRLFRRRLIGTCRRLVLLAAQADLARQLRSLLRHGLPTPLFEPPRRRRNQREGEAGLEHTRLLALAPMARTTPLVPWRTRSNGIANNIRLKVYANI